MASKKENVSDAFHCLKITSVKMDYIYLHCLHATGLDCPHSSHCLETDNVLGFGMMINIIWFHICLNKFSSHP